MNLQYRYRDISDMLRRLFFAWIRSWYEIEYNYSWEVASYPFDTNYFENQIIKWVVVNNVRVGWMLIWHWMIVFAELVDGDTSFNY